MPPNTTTTDQIASAASPAVMTIREFCEWARIGRTAVYAQARAKKLTLCKIGAKTVVRRDDAEAWLRSLPAAA
jgi:hypothetical protein